MERASRPFEMIIPQPMMIRPKVKNDEDEKLVNFVYRYKHGLMLFLR